MSQKRPNAEVEEQPKAKRSRFSSSGNQPNGSVSAAQTNTAQNGSHVDDKAEKLRKAREILAKKDEIQAKLAALKAKAAAIKPAIAPAASTIGIQSQVPEQAASVSQAQPAKLPPPNLPPPAPSAEPSQAPRPSHYDPFLTDKSAGRLQRRARRDFDFVKQGTFQKEAEQRRLKAALGEDAFKKQARQKEEERRDAAANAVADANLVPLGQRAAPQQPEKPSLEPIPELEWWDSLILQRHLTTYPEEDSEQGPGLQEEKLTIYVEHPVPIEPPAEEAPPEAMPMPLTQKERKKMRTQRRVEKEKEKQELQRQGLLDPAKPKLKLSTFYRSLGAEASADPTLVEKRVREDQEARLQAHEDRNLASKLTPAERREKKIEKLVGAAKEGQATPVTVYRVSNLESRQHRFKVKVNAEELHMTGCAVITDTASLIIAEGGPKAQKKYAHVVLNRIKWNDVADDADDEIERPQNECVKMWTGSIKEPLFENFSLEICRTEAAARKFLEDRGVQHYWDLAMADTAKD